MNHKILTLIFVLVSLTAYSQEAKNKKINKVIKKTNSLPFTIDELCNYSKMDYKEYKQLLVKDVFLKYELEKSEDDPYLFRIFFYDYNLFQSYLLSLGLNQNKIWTEKIIDKTRYIIFHKSFDDNGERLFDEKNRMYFILSITY